MLGTSLVIHIVRLSFLSTLGLPLYTSSSMLLSASCTVLCESTTSAQSMMMDKQSFVAEFVYKFNLD